MPSILIVEDELIVAEDLAQALSHLGYTVAAGVSSAEDAVRAVEASNPDLILMDVNLGDGVADGIEAAERIQSLFDIPVVYLTALSEYSFSYARRAIGAGERCVSGPRLECLVSPS